MTIDHRKNFTHLNNEHYFLWEFILKLFKCIIINIFNLINLYSNYKKNFFELYKYFFNLMQNLAFCINDRRFHVRNVLTNSDRLIKSHVINKSNADSRSSYNSTLELAIF